MSEGNVKNKFLRPLLSAHNANCDLKEGNMRQIPFVHFAH